MNTFPELLFYPISASFIYVQVHAACMVPRMRLGLMATLDDFKAVSALEVDFVEVLVREGDDLTRLDHLLGSEERDLIVHAPERMHLDGRSCLIDLADEDPSKREAFVQRIDDVSSLAGRYGIPTVVHPGGVRKHLAADHDALLRNLTNSLSSVGGKVWIENMPRRYHCDGELLWSNLVRGPEDALAVLPYVDGVTLDISHAYLSVEKGGNSAIASFFETLKGRVKHVHLSDASYPHNEGLQLGEGEVDLSSLPRMTGVPVLLEIQGGHRNGLAGFREALRRIKQADGWFRGCVP